ncbi:hypothetical protein RSO01_38510 [Reyranella soli]|uniref:Uncharacterized protein n=1 Tax=Reyranella soli TaxID=1230389 RepID=A0A512NCM0_9HYPH|nr:hypothetical protein RSO01_38510 [Reyranella soli]
MQALFFAQLAAADKGLRAHAVAGQKGWLAVKLEGLAAAIFYIRMLLNAVPALWRQRNQYRVRGRGARSDAGRWIGRTTRT